MHDIATIKVLNEGPFVVGFIRAMLFAETIGAESDDGGDLSFQEAGYDIACLSPAALDKVRADCRDFQELAAAELQEAQGRGVDLESLGHDFYFTRQGHGVGYWDRGLGQLGQALTAHAKTFGGIYPYVSDANSSVIEVQ